MKLRVLAGGAWLGGIALLLAGCSTLARNPVPSKLTPTATVPGMPDVRAWAGRPNAAMASDFAKSFEQESATDFHAGAEVFDPVSMTALFEVSYLYALEGPVWSTEPPGFREVPASP